MSTEQTELSAAQQRAVQALAARARRVDQTGPLNDAAQLALTGRGSSRTVHWLDQVDDQLVGYAQLDLRDGSLQLVIDPAHRRTGRGTALVNQILASGHPVRTWWAFGDLPAARALADKLGLHVVRALFIMTLDAARSTPNDVELPTGITLDHFHSADLDRLVAVNAAAFATHPEQGALQTADFLARMQQPWYRDTDLLVARDAEGRLIGYHWTKLEQRIGEVYVIGVDPDWAGRGVGRALLAAGIMHMRARGAEVIELYVAASNQRVITMYHTAGFEVTHTDVAYGQVQED